MLQAALTLVQQGLTSLRFLKRLPALEQLRICQPSFEMPDLGPITCLTTLRRCAPVHTAAGHKPCLEGALCLCLCIV